MRYKHWLSFRLEGPQDTQTKWLHAVCLMQHSARQSIQRFLIAAKLNKSDRPPASRSTFSINC